MLPLLNADDCLSVVSVSRKGLKLVDRSSFLFCPILFCPLLKLLLGQIDSAPRADKRDEEGLVEEDESGW
jgi:hypothetical protein